MTAREPVRSIGIICPACGYREVRHLMHELSAQDYSPALVLEEHLAMEHDDDPLTDEQIASTPDVGIPEDMQGVVVKYTGPVLNIEFGNPETLRNVLDAFRRAFE